MSNPADIAKLLDALNELYELGPVISVAPLGEPESERCWKIITSAGSFVARRYRVSTRSQVELSTGFLRWCQMRHFQLAPELVPGKTGDDYFTLDASQDR